MLNLSKESASQRTKPDAESQPHITGCNFCLQSSTFLSVLCHPPGPPFPSYPLGKIRLLCQGSVQMSHCVDTPPVSCSLLYASRVLWTIKVLVFTVQQMSTVTDNYNTSHMCIFNCLIATLKK